MPNAATGDLAFFKAGYYRHDLRKGTLHGRTGTKLCYLPSELLYAMQRVLEDETGPAWRSILKSVGGIWGRRVARRFEGDVSEYYGRALHELPMSEMIALLEGYFRHHGWGSLRFDFTAADDGLIQATLEGSAFAEIVGANNAPVDSIASGLLAEFVAQVSERDDIECFETECVAMGAPRCRFVIGIASRMKKLGDWLESGIGHDEGLQRLVAAGKGRHVAAVDA